MCPRCSTTSSFDRNTHPTIDELTKAWAVLLPEVRLTLLNHNIQYSFISVTRRHFPGSNPPPNATVCITASTSEDDRWTLFLEDTYELFLRLGFDNLSIEIIDPKARNGMSTFPIGSSNAIEDARQLVRASVLETLGTKQ